MNLSRFPRLSFAHLPTPLEPMKRLTELLGGPRLWIKRDDCTGLSGGGNKTRKLEFLMAEAVAQGADTIITQGATQSNHARQTAAIAAKLNMTCHLLLEDRTGSNDPSYNFNGNVLLDRLHGATVSRRPGGADMQSEMEKLADQLRQEGRKPYIIVGGGSSPLGALGYANAALEMLYQAGSMGLNIGTVVHATGSSGTQAGLVAGFKALGSGIPVLGIGVRAPKEKQEDMVFKLAHKTADYMGLGDIVERADVQANCDYVGAGYGLPTKGMVDAVQLLAKTEGILLDPVYSGKGMDGLIDLVRKGSFKKDSDVVFVHTGGAAGLFGYPDQLDLPGYV